MKHRIKLCTKIQIYYSYCIPFSTDFLGFPIQRWAAGRWRAAAAGREAPIPADPGVPGCRSVSRHGSVPRCHPAGPQGATYRLRQPRQRVPHGPSSPHPHGDRPPPPSHRRPRSRSRPPGAPPAAGCPCQRPPATGTETRPLLRTLLHREGCGGRPGKPTRRSGQQSRGRASAACARDRVLRPPRAGEPQPGTRPGRRCEPSHGWEPAWRGEPRCHQWR